MIKNANTRKIFYGVSSAITGILVLLVSLNLIDHGMETKLETLIAALVGVFGTGATATAAYHTNKQINDGSLDPASKDSPPLPTNPAEVVIGGLQELDNLHKQVQQGYGAIQEVANSVGIALPQLGIPNMIPANIPGISAVANQNPIAPGSLAALAIEASKNDNP